MTEALSAAVSPMGRYYARRRASYGHRRTAISFKKAAGGLWRAGARAVSASKGNQKGYTISEDNSSPKTWSSALS